MGSNISDDELEELRRWLERHMSIGTKYVKVMSSRDSHVCPTCQEWDGNIYDIERAYEEDLIPHDDCENERCRCFYLPRKKKGMT